MPRNSFELKREVFEALLLLLNPSLVVEAVEMCNRGTTPDVKIPR